MSIYKDNTTSVYSSFKQKRPFGSPNSSVPKENKENNEDTTKLTLNFKPSQNPSKLPPPNNRDISSKLSSQEQKAFTNEASTFATAGKSHPSFSPKPQETSSKPFSSPPKPSSFSPKPTIPPSFSPKPQETSSKPFSSPPKPSSVAPKPTTPTTPTPPTPDFTDDIIKTSSSRDQNVPLQIPTPQKEGTKARSRPKKKKACPFQAYQINNVFFGIYANIVGAKEALPEPGERDELDEALENYLIETDTKFSPGFVLAMVYTGYIAKTMTRPEVKKSFMERLKLFFLKLKELITRKKPKIAI